MAEPDAGPDKGRRIATAMAFLFGVLACLDALRDAKNLWPPQATWAALPHAQRMELGAGIALALAGLVIAVINFRSSSDE